MAFSQRLSVAAPVLAAALTASCATLPQPHPAPAPVALASDQSFSAPNAAWPAAAWWQAYGDPQLTALIEEGLSGSPTLAAAEARVRAANAGTAVARGVAGPSVGLEGSAVLDKESYNAGIPAAFVPQGYNDYGRVALDFSYDLDFWGRNRQAIAAAASQARAADAEAAQARLMLSTGIAEAYADLVRLSAERAIAAQALDVRNQTAALVQRRVQAGLDTRGEQREAEARPPAARAQIAALDESIAVARNRIAALVGAGPDRGLAITAPAETAPQAFGLPANLAADLIGRRPDVVAARWRAEAANARIGVARAAFYPNINLAAFIGVRSLGLDNLTTAGSDIGAVGPAFSLPIFESGRLNANLSRAEAERDEAVAAYNGALVEALHQVADAAAGERAIATRLQESQTALAASEDAYRITRARYQGGLTNYQAVLIAEDAVLAQRMIVADLQSRRFSLDVALVRALGGGFAAQ